MKTQANVSQKKLRRIAPRTLRVIGRHGDSDPALAVIAAVLGPIAAEFIGVYDRLRQFLATRKNETRHAQAALMVLVRRIRKWAPILARDVGTINVGDFGENPDVPDDVIGDGHSLTGHAEKYVDADGNPLPYLADLIADLTPALEAAEKEWSEAEEATKGYTALRDETRAAALAFEEELITFRQVLRNVIGRTHPDYQKLRTARARVADVEDDANAPEIGEGPVEPEESTPAGTVPADADAKEDAA